jgi:hypothetical protein
LKPRDYQDLGLWSVTAAWQANPAQRLAHFFVAMDRWRESTMLAAGAVVVSLNVLPRYGEIIAGMPGYWVWVASMALVFVCGAFVAIIRPLWRRISSMGMRRMAACLLSHD